MCFHLYYSEPCVRFGVYTNSQVSRDGKNMRLRDSGINGSHAYHMVSSGKAFYFACNHLYSWSSDFMIKSFLPLLFFKSVGFIDRKEERDPFIIDEKKN